MISSPSLCDAASTRSASSAGCSRASFGCGTRSRTVGTCPVNGSTVAQSRNVPSVTAARERTREEPAQQPAQADVDADDAVPALEARELDLVRAHEPGAVDVDQLPVEHVLLQQHLAPAAARSAGGRDGRRRSVTRPCSICSTCSAGTNTCRPGDARDDPADRRIVVLAEPNDQVVDAAEPLARRVAQLAADDEREVQDERQRRGGRGHAASVEGVPDGRVALTLSNPGADPLFGGRIVVRPAGNCRATDSCSSAQEAGDWHPESDPMRPGRSLLPRLARPPRPSPARARARPPSRAGPPAPAGTRRRTVRATSAERRGAVATRRR